MTKLNTLFRVINGTLINFKRIDQNLSFLRQILMFNYFFETKS